MANVPLTYSVAHQVFRELARGFFDFRIVGADRLDFAGSALVCCNHASFLDPPFIGQAFPMPIHFFARKTLFDNPVLGWLLRRWQVIPIDRDKPDAASLKTTIRMLKQGEKVLMFPEGTRCTDGKLLPARAGVGLFIAKSKAPVLPMRLYGTFDAYPKGAKLLKPASVTLVVGELWQPDLTAVEGREGRDVYQGLADEVMRRIAALTV
jgi:1-acyl-sn-glycerol-3-phosphate acyltransferase